MKRILLIFAISLLLTPALTVFGNTEYTRPAENTRSIRILATSDLHGKSLPWDYMFNKEKYNGSAAQLATAIAAYRTDQTLLVDAGDLIQGNFANLFVHSDAVHPMVQALNQMQYDVWVTGNHDYNFGMDVLRKTISDLDATVLTGNVYDESGDPIAAGYQIFDLDGVRVAVIGMVTPNIAHWDKNNLRGYTVTDPLEETRGIIDSIQGQYDALIGVFHMGIQNEYGVPDSGVTDICNACPEFDVVVSSHEHELIESMDINGVLVVQNEDMAKTMFVIDIDLEADGDGWRVADKTAQSISISEYEPDPAIVEMLEEEHEMALAESVKVIGVLKGGDLVPANESAEDPGSDGEQPKVPDALLSDSGIPIAQVQDTPMMDLINQAQLYYSGAQVSAAPLTSMYSNMEEGDIHLYDVANIYRFSNTLYTVRMNGGQLKKLMEWTTQFFETVSPDHPEVTADPDFLYYNYLIFEGVNYEIDLSRPVGERIRNLTWPDGTPVEETDSFLLTLNNYNAASQVLVPGEIYTEDDLPEMVEMDVRGDLGGVQELISEYIIQGKDGILEPECNDNWKIVW